MLSNAERALRFSSNSNAPLQCWGCKDIYSPCDHLYKDCPHQKDSKAQAQFAKNLQDFLDRRNQRRLSDTRFSPQSHKKDGFLTKNVSSLFNDIAKDGLDAGSRKSLINTFVTECSANGAGRATRRSKRKAPDDSDGAMALPFWLLEDNKIELPEASSDEEDDDEPFVGTYKFGSYMCNSISYFHRAPSH